MNPPKTMSFKEAMDILSKPCEAGCSPPTDPFADFKKFYLETLRDDALTNLARTRELGDVQVSLRGEFGTMHVRVTYEK